MPDKAATPEPVREEPIDERWPTDETTPVVVLEEPDPEEGETA